MKTTVIGHLPLHLIAPAGPVITVQACPFRIPGSHSTRETDFTPSKSEHFIMDLYWLNVLVDWNTQYASKGRRETKVDSVYLYGKSYPAQWSKDV